MERIEKLKTLLHASPDDCFLKHALGLEYIKMGNDQDAKALFREIISTNPQYVGTYYHLAKLFERLNDRENAVKTYEQGLVETEKAGDMHAYRELKGAYEEFIF